VRKSFFHHGDGEGLEDAAWECGIKSRRALGTLHIQGYGTSAGILNLMGVQVYLMSRGGLHEPDGLSSAVRFYDSMM